MGVRVDVLPREDERGPALALSRRGPPTAESLEHEIGLTPEVRLRVDLSRPTDWRRLVIGDRTPSLVRALVGDRAARLLAGVNHMHPPTELAVESAFASPWVRVAVLHGLDRWLQLPLEQDLLQAEIGTATYRAARELPEHDGVRERLTDEALVWVRRAAVGLVEFLQGLTALPPPVPAALRRAANSVIDGYAALRDLVAEPDDRLAEVVAAGRALQRQASAEPVTRAAHIPTSEDAEAGPVKRAVSLIDPRQVRARVLRLSDQPQTAEISLSPVRAENEDAVRLQVPAFDHRVDPEIAHRLMARLVSRTSGRDHSFAALTVRARPSLFEATFPLRGSDLRDLRADVFDALLVAGDLPDTGDNDLVRVRRAVLSLRESRRQAAQAELQGDRRSGPGRPLLAELAAAHHTAAA